MATTTLFLAVLLSVQIFGTKGFTVHLNPVVNNTYKVYEKGNTVLFEVENFSVDEVIIKDADDNYLISIRRKRLGQGIRWQIFNINDLTRPLYIGRKLSNSADDVHVELKPGPSPHPYAPVFEILGSYNATHKNCDIIDHYTSGEEVTAVRIYPGRHGRGDVFKVRVSLPNIRKYFAMSMVVVLDKFYRFT